MFLGREKKLTFSIRKLQAGVASVAIAAAFLGGLQPSLVEAEEQATNPVQTVQETDTVEITYLSVDEGVLSQSEKARIRYAPVSELTAVQDDLVVLVYAKTGKQLPATGELPTLLPALMGLGTLLAVYKLGKKGRRELVAILVLGGTMTMSAQVLAQNLPTIDVRQESVVVGSSLRDKDIAGYRYIGYLTDKDLDQQFENLLNPKAKTEVQPSPDAPNLKDPFVTQVPHDAPEVDVPVYNPTDVNATQVDKVPDDAPVMAVPNYDPTDVDAPQVGAVPNDSPTVNLPVAELSHQDDVVTEPINFGERRIDDPNLPFGETRVEEGEGGERRIVTRRYYIDGELVKEVRVDDTVTRPARDRIIYIGTKPVSKVPDDAPVIDLPNYKVSDVHVTHIPSNPPAVERPVAVVRYEDDLVTEPIAFGERRVEDPNLPVGETRVEEGIPGEKTIVTRHTYIDDVLDTSEIIHVENTRPPHDRIVYVGTKKDKPIVTKVPDHAPSVALETADLREEVSRLVTDIPFNEQVQEDNQRFEDEERQVVTEGRMGQRTVTTTRYFIDGQLVDTRTETVETPAQDSLVRVGTLQRPDKTSLTALVAEAEQLKSQDIYGLANEAVKSPFDTALAEAKLVLADDRATVDSVRTALNTLTQAKNGLNGSADKTALEALVRDALAVKSTDRYNQDRAEDKAAFDTSLSDAQDVLNDTSASQASVDNVKAILREKFDQLDGAVDKTALNEVIQASDNALSTYVYYNELSNEEKVVFTQALERAKAVFNQADVTQTVVDEAKTALAAAKEQLDGLMTNKEALRELVRQSNEAKLRALYRNEPTESEKTAFDTALARAETILNRENATQAEVDEAYAQLTAAKNKLDGVEEEKHLEFRNVTDALLYKKEGANLVLVTGLSEVPADKENYVLTFKNDGVNHTMPIAEFVAEGDKIAALIKYDSLTTYANGQFQPDFKHLIEKTVTGPDVYTSFDSLVSAMKSNPNGTFKLGSDVYATDTADATYLGDFRGTLTSVDGKKYAIYNLKKPFINNLIGATVKNIAFKDAQVVSQGDTAVLALRAENSTEISGVDVQGSLTFKPNSQTTRYIGGVVANLLYSSIKLSQVDLNITAVDKSVGQTLGGLVSRTVGGTLDKNIVKGSIILTDVVGSLKTNVAKVLPTAYFGSTISNHIANVTLSHGQGAFGRGVYDQNTRENVSAEEEAQLRQEWGLTSSQPVASQGQTTAKTDYSTVSGYQASREQAYRNTEKLLPLYDRQTIVRYGNKIADNHNLATKKVVSVTAMKGNQFVTNAYDKTVDKLFVLYEDKSSQVLPLQLLGEFKSTGVTEYALDNTLLYTSPIFTKLDDTFMTGLVNSLSSVEWTDGNLNPILNMTKNDKITQSLKDLYLDDSVAKIKANARTYLEKILSQDGNEDYSSPTVQAILTDKISRNKEKIVLALAYLDKLYGVNFGSYNIKDLVTFKPSFYGQPVNTLDWLIDLGSHTYSDLLLNENKPFFDNYMATDLGVTDLVNFLDTNRTIFTPSKSASDWFKSATKAFIHEENTGTLPTNVDVYHRLTTIDKFKRYLLPLLNMQEESAYVVSNSSALVFGSYGRVIDTNLYRTNKAQYQAEMEKAHEKIRQASRQWQAYNELIASVVRPEVKNQLTDKITEVWDGYLIRDSVAGKDEKGMEGKRRWADRFDENFVAIKDFFGPAGRYFTRSASQPSAYARRDVQRIYFDSVDLLDHFGPATLNHELVHVYDELAVLNGYHHRPGQDTESYALGLFESTTSPNTPYYGFNLMYNLDKSGSLTTNASADRFKSSSDLQTYTKGLMDVTYLMDGLEAEVILSKDKADQRHFFNKLEQFKPTDEPTANKENQDPLAQHVNERIRPFRDDEWTGLTLNTVDDLVRQNVVSKSSLLREQEYKRDNVNNYYFLPLYYPIYAGLSNDHGTSSGLLFRRHALELLAEFGWENGFIPYATDQHLNEAKASNKALSDKFIFDKIFNGRYTTYTDFKVAQYQQRLDKKDQLRDVIVTYNNKTYNITDGASLKNLLQVAVEADLANMNANKASFERQKVKEAILTAYNKLTDGFKFSIFDNAN